MTADVPVISARSRLASVAGPLGLYRLAWALTRRRPRILMYHRFAAGDGGFRLGRETFRRQIRLIRKTCRLVTMRELAVALRGGPGAAAGLAAITVDDGYRDFYEHAWLVLQQEAAPATFFPATGFIDQETWLWPDLIEYVLERTRHRHVDATTLELGGQSSWNLDDPAQARGAWQAIVYNAIDLPDRGKWQYLEELYATLGVPWPTEIPARYAPLGWDQLRDVAASGIEVGAHTRSHCRLTRVDDPRMEDELAGARARLQDELQRPVHSFCYPNGAPDDYDARVMVAVERAGYASAVAAHFDGVQGGLYDLRRHGAGEDMTVFRKHLSGVEDLSWRWRTDAASRTTKGGAQ